MILRHCALALVLVGAISAHFAVAAAGCRSKGTSRNNSADDAAANIWGGEHIEMEVTRDGATLEFDCATGTIAEPLPVHSQGRFSVKGTFTP